MEKIIAGIVGILLYHSSAAHTGLFFTVSSTSNLTSTGTVLTIHTTIPNHTYPHAGIKLNTSGYSLSYQGSECTLNSNGYCLFSVNNTTAHSIHISGSTGNFSITLCLDGTAALSCQRYNSTVNYTGPRYAYIPNDDGFVSLCPINSDGSFGACVDGTPSQSGTLGNLYQIVFNPSGTFGYLTTFGNILLCPVNADKTLGECNSALDNVPGVFYYPYGIALNTAGTKAYVADQFNQAVYICTIGSDGTFTACADSGNTGNDFANPLGITLNTTQTNAYVANFANSAISLCPIINNGDNFGDCTYVNAYGGSGPGQVAINFAGTRAYIANGNDNTVSFCTVNAIGNFTTCVDSGNTGVAFNSPFSVVLNASETKAYVSNDGGNTVSICPLNANGTFGGCVDSGNTGLAFGGPEAITLVY